MGKNKPTHEIKLGRIKAVIWANQTKDQDVWFGVTLSRLYKDEGEWKDTTSLRRDDLPIASKALEMAYGWIWRQQMKLSETKSDKK